jgi:hypothetical protein
LLAVAQTGQGKQQSGQGKAAERVVDILENDPSHSRILLFDH